MRNAKVDVMQLFRLWNAGLETQAICDAMGVGRYKLLRLANKYGLPPRPHNERGVNLPSVDDPTPKEIRERCLAVQANWTDAEREKRLVGYSRGRVELTRFSFRQTDCSYHPLS